MPKGEKRTKQNKTKRSSILEVNAIFYNELYATNFRIFKYN